MHEISSREWKEPTFRKNRQHSGHRAIGRGRLAIGDAYVTSIITAKAVKEMRLRKGDSAAALIKSTDVMIERFDEDIG